MPASQTFPIWPTAGPKYRTPSTLPSNWEAGEQAQAKEATWQPELPGCPSSSTHHLYNWAEFLILSLDPQLGSSRHSYGDQQPWSQQAQHCSHLSGRGDGLLLQVQFQFSFRRSVVFMWKALCDPTWMCTPGLPVHQTEVQKTCASVWTQLLLLACSKGSQFSYSTFHWELPCGKALRAGIFSHNQWRPESCQQVPLTASGGRLVVLPRSRQMAQPGETWSRETQLSHAQIPAPQRLWNNQHLFCLKEAETRQHFSEKCISSLQEARQNKRLCRILLVLGA